MSVDESAAQGGALLLSGDAGVGKTVLLDAAAAHAAAARTQVVRAAGAEFEADLSFAALNQVLVTRLELVLSVVAAPAPARRSARRRGDKQGGDGDHERKTGEAHRDDGGSLRLPGEAAGGGERALLELDALVVLKKAGILGTRSAMVRVEAVRSVLMFGDHDVPPRPLESTPTRLQT